jgi:hypothetical protein
MNMITQEQIDRVYAAATMAPNEAEEDADKEFIRDVLETLSSPRSGVATRSEAVAVLRSSFDLANERGGTMGVLALSTQSRLRRAVLDELWPAPVPQPSA